MIEWVIGKEIEYLSYKENRSTLTNARWWDSTDATKVTFCTQTMTVALYLLDIRNAKTVIRKFSVLNWAKLIEKYKVRND